MDLRIGKAVGVREFIGKTKVGGLILILIIVKSNIDLQFRKVKWDFFGA